jgi:hypothetical protein
LKTLVYVIKDKTVSDNKHNISVKPLINV